MNSIIRPKSDFTFNCQIPDGKKVESKDSGEFKVHIMEKGTKYAEKIKVDEDNDIEYFHVPAHNGLTEADYLYDFRSVSAQLYVCQQLRLKEFVFFNFHVSGAFNSNGKYKLCRQKLPKTLTLLYGRGSLTQVPNALFVGLF